jgi:hypothetical protein
MNRVAEHEAHFRSTHQRKLSSQSIGKPAIVGIEKGDEFTARGLKAAIARGVGPGVRLRQHDDPIAEAVEHPPRLIRRSVIDRDHLDRRAGLFERTRHRARYPGGTVANGQNHRDERKRQAGDPFDIEGCRAV